MNKNLCKFKIISSKSTQKIILPYNGNIFDIFKKISNEKELTTNSAIMYLKPKFKNLATIGIDIGAGKGEISKEIEKAMGCMISTEFEKAYLKYLNNPIYNNMHFNCFRKNSMDYILFTFCVGSFSKNIGDFNKYLEIIPENGVILVFDLDIDIFQKIGISYPSPLEKFCNHLLTIDKKYKIEKSFFNAQLESASKEEILIALKILTYTKDDNIERIADINNYLNGLEKEDQDSYIIPYKIFRLIITKR